MTGVCPRCLGLKWYIHVRPNAEDKKEEIRTYICRDCGYAYTEFHEVKKKEQK